MGKAQKKKQMRRHNPMRVPDSHLPQGLAAASETSKKTESILPIIQKLNSADAAERKWACVAVSNLIQNDSSTRRLLQGKNVVGELITRLTDSEEEVVLEAMGSLRNLCIDGGYDICAEMYNKNILTPMKIFVQKISTVLSQYLENPKETTEHSKKLTYEFAENVTTVMWCLSETNNKALAAINEIDLIPFLMSFLGSRQKLALSPVIAAAQCLYVLTDDNVPAIRSLRADASHITLLLSMAQEAVPNVNGKSKAEDEYKHVFLRILVTGIIRNISPLPPTVAGSTLDIDNDIVLPIMQPVITSVSLSDIATTAHQLVDSIAAEPPSVEKLSLKHAPKSDHRSTHEVELEQLEGKLRSIQMALEILTGVCATLPDPSMEKQGDVDEEEDDNDDEMGEEGEEGLEEGDAQSKMDIEPNSDAEMSATSENEQPSFLPTLVPALLNLAHPTSLSFPPLAAPSSHPPTTSALSAIHVRAMECLNNIFFSLATSPNPVVTADKAGGQKVWDDVWTILKPVGTESGLGQERRQELWEVAAGVLWGIGVVYKVSLTATEEQIQVLINLCSSTSDEEVQVKCIGTLECLAQHPESVAANKVISDYLVSLLPVATTSLGAEPTIQVVSALIDIYSDETLPYDINFRQGGILQKLVLCVDGLKKTIRAINKKKEGSLQLRRRGDEVRENLVAFIQYRRRLRL